MQRTSVRQLWKRNSTRKEKSKKPMTSEMHNLDGCPQLISMSYCLINWLQRVFLFQINISGSPRGQFFSSCSIAQALDLHAACKW